ncbi:MAG: hypothetical protein R3C28_17380 [Pirellulaceae bacterium]
MLQLRKPVKVKIRRELVPALPVTTTPAVGFQIERDRTHGKYFNPEDLGQISYAIPKDAFTPYQRIDDGSPGGLAAGIRILVNERDVNSDKMCGAAAIDAISQAIRNGKSDARFDANQDGTVSNDRTHRVVELRPTGFADSNLDGEFNRSDFVAAFADAGYEQLGPRTGVANVPEPNLEVWSLFFAIIAVWRNRVRVVRVSREQNVFAQSIDFDSRRMFDSMLQDDNRATLIATVGGLAIT